MAAFFWSDFQAATSHAGANSQVATYSSHLDGIRATQSSGELRLYVSGGDALSAVLRKQLTALLRSGPTFHSVKIEDSPPSTVGGPALMVEISQREGLWTPVRATGHLVMKIVYASNGDLSWRDDSVVRMENRGQPLRRIRGEFQLQDSTNGLISQRGYDRHLGQSVAGQVSDSLLKALDNPG